MKVVALLLLAVADASQLTFRSNGATKSCDLKFDGTALSTNCKLGNGFGDPALGTRTATLEKDVKYLMDLAKDAGSGNGKNPFKKGSNGWDASSPGSSCQQILSEGYSRGDGTYFLKVPGSSQPAFEAYCDMTNANGGWTLVAKVMKGSRTMNSFNTAQWRHGTVLGDTKTLSNSDALGLGYKELKFNDVMMANLGDTTRHVAWRHPTTYHSMKRIADNGNRISDGAVLSGKLERLGYDRGDTSYHNFCPGRIMKYGFFTYDHSYTGSIAGHAMTTGHCGNFVGAGKYTYGDPGRCISEFGLGGSYGSGGESSDIGICAHWWGAGDSYTKDFHSIALYVRYTPKSDKNDGDGSSKDKPGYSCAWLQANGKATRTGSYWINPGKTYPFQVHCNMDTLGGGWTLLAKVKKGSSALNSFNVNAWRHGRTMGSVANLANEDALGKSYSTIPFNDIMMSNLNDVDNSYVAWRHPGSFTNMQTIADAGNRISDGQLIGGSLENLKYDRGDKSYHNFCPGIMKYGFFTYDHSYTGSIAGHSMVTGHCGNFVGAGKYTYGDPGRCISEFGLGGSYGSGGEATDNGICAHWWGAGDSYTRDFHTIALYVRYTEPITKMNGDGSSKTNAGESCKQLNPKRSGKYWINPNQDYPFQVYCNMDLVGGGWTLLAKVKKGSSVLNSFNVQAWRHGKALGDCTNLADKDCMSGAYSTTDFNEVMFANLQGGGHVAWRHPMLYSNMRSIAQSGSRINDGELFSGQPDQLRYDRGDKSYHNFCHQFLKYGFFTYDHSYTGSIAGHSMVTGHCGNFVGFGKYDHGDKGRCISEFGLGGSYGSGGESTDNGICAHWWGAGDSYTKDFHTIALYVRNRDKITTNNGDGSSAIKAASSCTAINPTKSGTYWINPGKNYPFQAYCYAGAGGGWTMVAKVAKNSMILNSFNTNAWRYGKPQGECTNLASTDCISPAYKQTKFRDVMMASLNDLNGAHVSWRHPRTFDNLVSIAAAGSRINDGTVLSGSLSKLKYTRGDSSYHNFCGGLKYGFFTYDHSYTGSIAGHSMVTGHCGNFVGAGKYNYGDPGRCISEFGLGGSYGSGGEIDDDGICAHWWGAGDSYTRDYESIGLFIRP